MRLLHRYLFRDVFIATVVAVAMFALVLVTGVAVHDLVSRAASGQLTIVQSARMLLLVLPSLLTYSLPFGLLTGVLLVLGRISAQHEITAMRSAGLGLIRISSPVLLIAVLGVGACLVINFYFGPRLKTEYRRLLFDIAQTNPSALVVPGQFVRDFPGVVIYTRGRDGDVLNDVWVWLLDKQHRVTLFGWAEQGSIEVDEVANTLSLYSRGELRLEKRDDKNPEDFSRTTMPMSGGSEDRYLIHRFELDDVFKRRVFTRKVSWMDIFELRAEAERLEGSTVPDDVARLQSVRMTLHENAARAFAVLSIALVAVPLGIQTRRKETSANLGIALGLLLVFESGIIAVGWLGRKPELYPHLLLWIPNVAFQLLAVRMWWRFGKN